MIIYLVYTQYGEDIVGVFSTSEKALAALPHLCTNKQTHTHPDDFRCGISEMPLDPKVDTP